MSTLSFFSSPLSEHIAFPKSTVQSHLPRPLLSEQQMPQFFFAPTSLSPHPPSFYPLDGSALSLNPCFLCTSSDGEIDLSTGRLWPLIWSDKGRTALTELDNQRGGTLEVRGGCFPFLLATCRCFFFFSMTVKSTVHLLPASIRHPGENKRCVFKLHSA